MRDLLILYVNEDYDLVKELNQELKVLGARTDLLNVVAVTELDTLLSQNISKYASTLVFLTSNFSEQLIKSTIIVKTVNKKVLFLPYKLNKTLLDSLKKQIRNIVSTTSKALPLYAIAIIKEMANKKRKIALRYSNKVEDMWNSPLSIYQKKEGLNKSREIVIDVAWSANPTRPEPAPALESALRQTLEHMGNTPSEIMDFGAGKLRHTVILLEAGHKVTAVEYPEIFLHPTETIKSFINRAQKNKTRFDRITYPDELITSKKIYDLIMLVNVTDIIPDPLERLFVLDQCNKKLKDGKFLLWFTQHGDIDQRNVVSDFITDGGCTIKQARKTFYTEFNKDSVDLMLSLLGFEREAIQFNTGKNQAWLYKKKGKPIIDIQEMATKIRKVTKRTIHVGAGNDTIIADVLDADSSINLGDVLSYNLSFNSGKINAYRYERLISEAVKYIFKDIFIASDITRQAPLQKGKLRIDIKASWRANSVLKDFLTFNKLESSFVPIECKNYSTDIGNEELAQILIRGNKDSRHFGIVTCRTIENEEKISDTLYEFFNDHNFLVVVLNDEDIKTLLKLQDEQQSHPPWIPKEDNRSKDGCFVTRYLEKRIEEILHHNKREKSSELYKQIITP